MKSKTKHLYTLIFLFSLSIIFFCNACNESGFAREIPKEVDLSKASLPEVIINQVSADKIVGNSVNLGCFIKSDGGARVIKSGICWDIQSNPTIEGGNLTTNGPIIGQIPGFISGLEYNAKYYARAYAINPKGISYSEVVSFTTEKKQEEKIFFDDFNRMTLGSIWKIYFGQFQIENNILRANSSGHLLYENEEAQIFSGDGHFFKLETDFQITLVSDYTFAGVIFNAKNANEFYVLRINGSGMLQFLATNDGGQNWPGIFVITNTGLVGKNTYHLQIISEIPGQFDVTIKRGEQVLFNEKMIDPEARFNGGYAGYYSLAEYSLYDNFSLLIK